MNAEQLPFLRGFHRKKKKRTKVEGGGEQRKRKKKKTKTMVFEPELIFVICEN